MEKKVSFFEAWNRALSLEVERQYFNRYLGKNLTPLALDAQPPSSEALEAELEALARALTPERLCGVVRLAPEGLYLFEEAVFLRYQDAWGFWQENIHISYIRWRFIDLESTMETLDRLFPLEDWWPEGRRRRHLSRELLEHYAGYLSLTHTPQDPGAWAWLLVFDWERVEKVLDQAIAAWLGNEEASQAFRELFQPWEVFQHVGSLASFLHAHRLMALDRERFKKEWRRYPGALLLFLGFSPLGWEAYREFLRWGFALLQAQGWGRKTARWLQAYPLLADGDARLSRLLLAAGILQEPQRGIPWVWQSEKRELLLDFLEKHPQLSPPQEAAVVAVLRAWERSWERAELVRPLLKMAAQKPERFSSLGKNLGLEALARRVFDRPRPLFPSPFSCGQLVAEELLSPQALEEEGKAMGHCLEEENWASVLLDEERFFSLRDGADQRVATLRLEWVSGAWKVAELRGPGNARVTEEVAAFAEELARAAGTGALRPAV